MMEDTRHEGDQWPQDQVGKGVNPAADEAVVLQDLAISVSRC